MKAARKLRLVKAPQLQLSDVMNPLALAMRAKVNAAQEVMFTMPQVETPLKHYFAKGVYAREMFIPKDTVLVGKIHKYENLSIMSKGDLSVLTEEGVKRVQAPFTIVAPPGTKRIAYAHEDTIWTSIHGTDETDLEKIEAEFIAQTDEEYLEFCRLLQVKGVK